QTFTAITTFALAKLQLFLSNLINEQGVRASMLSIKIGVKHYVRWCVSTSLIKDTLCVRVIIFG
ncbi:MAG: hypothetical protein KAH18_04275, partial [Psychromonas sp.]|nr:hypothetical protein [Psychromonas sp.]